jgi:hypothetical protein
MIDIQNFAASTASGRRGTDLRLLQSADRISTLQQRSTVFSA